MAPTMAPTKASPHATASPAVRGAIRAGERPSCCESLNIVSLLSPTLGPAYSSRRATRCAGSSPSSAKLAVVPAPRFVTVLVEANPGCPEECALRFKAEDEPHPVRRVRYDADGDGVRECGVTGWSSEQGGTATPAMAVTIEDSSVGVAVLIWGGDWGLRLAPIDGSTPFGEPYLRIAPDDVLE